MSSSQETEILGLNKLYIQDIISCLLSSRETDYNQMSLSLDRTQQKKKKKKSILIS